MRALAPPAPLRDESGSMLIEVLATSVVVVLMALGIFAGIDGAQATSGVGRARAQAASLAQQDQERMRGYAIGRLSNLVEDRDTTIANVSYHIASRGEWIADTSRTTGCATGAGLADYLKITSTVTATRLPKLGSIKSDSLVAPPAGSYGPGQGALVVQINDRDANGVAGIQVNVSGPTSVSGQTNSRGCVLFGYLAVGSYTVSFNQPGYVNEAGNQAVSDVVGVAGEKTNTAPYSYDRAGAVAATFDTNVTFSGGPNRVGPARARQLMVGHPSLPSPGRRGPFGSTPAPSATVTATGLFPFSSPYGVFAGSCADAQPTTPQTTQVNPAASSSPVVRMPNLDAKVIYGGQPLGGATIVATPTTAGCGPRAVLGVTAASGTYAGRVPPEAPAPGAPAGSIGFVPTALPVGTYNVCAQASGYYKPAATPVPLTSDSSSVVIDGSAGPIPGNCP